jgi:hypothetical protein
VVRLRRLRGGLVPQRHLGAFSAHLGAADILLLAVVLEGCISRATRQNQEHRRKACELNKAAPGDAYTTAFSTISLLTAPQMSQTMSAENFVTQH